MAVRLLQPSFGGGEYDPALWGRQDLGRYGISGRLVRNFIVRATGGMETRPGTRFVGAAKDSARPVRLLPFQVSEELGYMVVANGGVFQFVYRGAFVMNGANRVEVAHPYTDAELPQLRFTQSADTLFITHNNHACRLLKRASATSFTLTTFVPREGPFRSINGNEALLVTSSAKTGTVTVTANFDLFTAAMVGGLLYLEPKALGNIKPWVQGERTGAGTLAAGVMRRSDGKVYQASTVPNAGASPNYTETGNVRPIHEIGKEWDGPGDTRKFDTINYIVGVEWEYLHSGYGIIEITGFTNARTATGVVKKTLPAEVVGGLGTPGSTWLLSGDGVKTTFPIPGAVSTSTSNYTVEISGTPVQADPNYTAPSGNTGTGGGSLDGSSSPTYEP